MADERPVQAPSDNAAVLAVASSLLFNMLQQTGPDMESHGQTHLRKGMKGLDIALQMLIFVR